MFFQSYFSIYISLICSHIICTCTSPFILQTHWVAFWWLWICTCRYYKFSSIDQVFREHHTLYVEPEFSYLIIFSRYFLSFLYSIAFIILCIGLMFALFLYLSVIMCGCLYVTLQWC